MVITEEGIRVQLQLKNYSKRRDTITTECYMMLYPTYLQYKVVGEAEVLDPDTEMWKEEKYNWRWTRKKGCITDINMYYDNKEDNWSVGIEFGGVSGTGNEWICDSPKHALSIYNQLVDYMTT